VRGRAKWREKETERERQTDSEVGEFMVSKSVRGRVGGREREGEGERESLLGGRAGECQLLGGRVGECVGARIQLSLAGSPARSRYSRQLSLLL
jgi:hypothetical protein